MTKEPGKPREHATGPRPEPTKLLDVAPDRLPLTERRAKYLADLAGVEVRTIKGKTIAEAHEALRWRLDPLLLLFRRICGRVVKKDPVTGDLLPVPNATVHVEDTDCSFLGYFPKLSPYVWLHPFRCRREEIATVRTDDCGRFCVFLPFWDIDRILRWRRLRVCLWEYYRPRIRDIVERIPEPRVGPIPGGPPLPDPPRFRRIAPEALEQLRYVAGDAAVQRLEAASDLVLQGERTTVLDDVLDTPLFAKAVPPPLPEKLATRKELGEIDVATLGLDPRLGIEKVDIRALVGPFLRCFDIFVPVWQTVLDVPDITFQVTQDYDNDGVEEVIYSEGFFDVRWNSGSIPDVTLEASALAVATANCGPVVDIACANVASIEAAGYLDLEPAYHDDVHGYGLRVNRPTSNGDYPAPSGTGVQSDPATAPYWGNLNLHGCARLAEATHYRLKYQDPGQRSRPVGCRDALPRRHLDGTAPGAGRTDPVRA